MSKHLIFFIHGMGQHGEDWSQAAQAGLKAAYASYPELKDLPFDEHFECIELVYDWVFEEFRKKMKADALNHALLMGNEGLPPELVSTLININASLSKNTFFSTHILDVLFYRFLSLARRPVLESLNEQIIDHLSAANQKGSVKWSVVAHSLGTAVAHDLLHAMFNPNGPSMGLTANTFPPHAALFAANVSRLLERDIKAYESVVRPSQGRKTGVLQYFLNASHKLDPFTKPKAFNPEYDWLDAQTRQLASPRYLQLEISEVLEANVHSLTHYLANPGVHIPFIRCLHSTQSVIGAQSERKAIAAHQLKADQAATSALGQTLRALIDKQQPGVSGLIESAQQYYALL